MHEKPHKKRLKYKILQLHKLIVSKAMKVGTICFYPNLAVLTIAGNTAAWLHQERKQANFQASSLNNTSTLMRNWFFM